MRVYLSGTMKTSWRSKVKLGCLETPPDAMIPVLPPSLTFLEPTPQDEVDLDLACWGLTDTLLLNRADLILAWLDISGDNQETCFEVGYAAAKGIPILLGIDKYIREQDGTDFRLMRAWATHIFRDLEQAVDILKEASKQL